MDDITPAELFLLNCLYEIGEGDLAKLLERLESKTGNDQKDWKKSTVLTLLKRLIDKGYVIRVKQGRYFFYRPKLTWSETIEFALQRFFGSSYRSILFSYFLSTPTLNKREEEWLHKFQQSLKKEKREP